MVLVLIVVIGLVAWSLHLMQEATAYREFSLMLAGTLVAISAAGLMVVYFLMNGYMGYMTSDLHHACRLQNTAPGLVEVNPEVNQGLTVSLEVPLWETQAGQNTFSLN